jgi:hypothetical protein
VWQRDKAAMVIWQRGGAARDGGSEQGTAATAVRSSSGAGAGAVVAAEMGDAGVEDGCGAGGWRGAVG